MRASRELVSGENELKVFSDFLIGLTFTYQARMS